MGLEERMHLEMWKWAGIMKGQFSQPKGIVIEDRDMGSGVQSSGKLSVTRRLWAENSLLFLNSGTFVYKIKIQYIDILNINVKCSK